MPPNQLEYARSLSECPVRAHLCKLRSSVCVRSASSRQEGARVPYAHAPQWPKPAPLLVAPPVGSPSSLPYRLCHPAEAVGESQQSKNLLHGLCPLHAVLTP